MIVRRHNPTMESSLISAEISPYALILSSLPRPAPQGGDQLLPVAAPLTPEQPILPAGRPSDETAYARSRTKMKGAGIQSVVALEGSSSMIH